MAKGAVMIADLKPYQAVKDSGIEWLGEVPEHWVVRRLKNLCIQSALYGANVSAASYTNTGVRFIRTTDITNDGLLKQGGVFLPKDLTNGYLLSDGDILISRSGTVGRSFLYNSRLHGSCSYAGYLVRFVPSSRILPNYLFLFTKTEAFSGFLRVMAISSTIENVNGEKYANAHVPLPPIHEQTAIVRYLNYVEQRVRRSVRAKQKLIELLKEQKRAIIHRAVTRGLDPNVPLKDSGVKWLGEVPVHWQVRRLRNATDMRVSNVDKHVKAEEVPVRLCNYVDVYKNDHISEQIDFMRATATNEESERFRLSKGDVLITKDSETWDDIGVPALVTNPTPDLVSGYHLALLRPYIDEISGEYLLRTLQSRGLAHQFYVKANGVTRYGLTHAAIKSVWLPLPPLPEQTAIVKYLDRATADIDTTIARARREIELLQEYRTRLIADVVTGKVDVRGVATDLPDEFGDSEPIGERDALSDIDEETARIERLED